MQKNFKNFVCYLGCTLVIGSTIAMSIPKIAHTEKINVQKVQSGQARNAKKGSFQKDDFYITIGNETILCKKYIANDSDSLSTISKKACRELYGQKGDTIYWPVIAYINNKKNTIVVPGEEFLCPVSLDDAITLLEMVNENGYKSYFIKKNHVYSKKYSTVRDEIAKICKEYYGIQVTEEFVQKYINAQKKYLKNPKYKEILNPEHEIKTNDEKWILTEWLPTLEDLGYSKKKK